MKWYKIFIRYWITGLCVRYVLVKDKWDLFAFIGYFYSTSTEKIDRIDYAEVKDEMIEKDKIISSSLRSKYR